MVVSLIELQVGREEAAVAWRLRRVGRLPRRRQRRVVPGGDVGLDQRDKGRERRRAVRGVLVIGAHLGRPVGGDLKARDFEGEGRGVGPGRDGGDATANHLRARHVLRFLLLDAALYFFNETATTEIYSLAVVGLQIAANESTK